MPTMASSTTHRPDGSDLNWTREGPQRALRMMTLPPTLIDSESSAEEEGGARRGDKTNRSWTKFGAGFTKVVSSVLFGNSGVN